MKEMIVKQIIPANFYHDGRESRKNGGDFLHISEFFYDSIQGEGIYIGHPAAFLRLQGCVLNCSYCDTREVWKRGSSFSFEELYCMMDDHKMMERFYMGQHLVITGGSPLMQEESLFRFLWTLRQMAGFSIFTELENECVILPTFLSDHHELISCWNNSPKLASSGIPFEKRYKPEIISRMARFKRSWFKFVITSEVDWEEIEIGFLDRGLIDREQVILMPKGETKAELELYRNIALELAIEHNVRYSSREHISIWDKKVGV